MRFALVVLAVACSSPSPSKPPDAAPPPADASPPPERYDVLVRGGTIYDGSGGAPFSGDVAIRGDRIVRVGVVPPGSTATTELDARGLAVAPGFVNVLSHAEESLIHDPRGLSDVMQGVTLDVFGEVSMGPMTPGMKKAAKRHQWDIKYELAWDTLGQYLDWLAARGIGLNVASLVGAGTIRENVMGLVGRASTPAELEKMKALVAQAMDEGALGLSTALIYTPDTFLTTADLVALATVAGDKGGLFTAHMRNEGNHIEEAIDELATVARDARIPVEIYHFKLGGKANWGKLDRIVGKIEALRADGLAITADMYTYPAGRTGFDAAMPPWVREGGYDAWAKRLRDPAIRARVKAEMRDPATAWDNLYAGAGPEGILLTAFKNPKLRGLIGRRLSDVARERGQDAEDVAMDLVIEDGSRVGVIYFIISEDNIRREVALPWMSFGSDEDAQAPEGLFLNDKPHPRAYGNFARLLGKYVRDERAVPLAEAIRRITSFPAETYGIADRGRLVAGAFADVVVFDPATIADHATFEQPQQLATGVRDVLVNGVPVVRDGAHTGAKPGRVVRRARTSR